MRKQINEVAPLVAALMGALVGMGLEKNKAKKAAQQAVNKSQGGSTWQDPDAVSSTKPKTKRTGVLQNGKIIRQGNQVKRLQQLLYGKTEGPQIDGKFGPNTEKALKTFQKNQGLQVDGIAGPETIKRLNRMQEPEFKGKTGQAPIDGGIAPGTTKGGPSRLQSRQRANSYGEGTNMSNTKQINEEITISGSADDLIRMMQLAGASGAKAVDIDDINQAPETPCGASKPEPDMGDMVRMMSTTEDDGAMGDEYDDEPSAPDEVYMNDVSASIPNGDDLHKKKRSYPKAAGGDNPMALEAELRDKLLAALEEKKKSPAGGPACWDGKKIHPTKPTKMKGGKRVNNCIDADSSDGK